MLDVRSKATCSRRSPCAVPTAHLPTCLLVLSFPQGVERLVIDVRNNGGGLFPAGVEIGRMLINRGDIVLIADRSALPPLGVALVHGARRAPALSQRAVCCAAPVPTI